MKTMEAKMRSEILGVDNDEQQTHAGLATLLNVIRHSMGFIGVTKAIFEYANADLSVFSKLLEFMQAKSVDALEKLVPKECLGLYGVESVDDLFAEVSNCRERLARLFRDDMPPAVTMEGLDTTDLDRYFDLEKILKASGI